MTRRHWQRSRHRNRGSLRERDLSRQCDEGDDDLDSTHELTRSESTPGLKSKTQPTLPADSKSDARDARGLESGRIAERRAGRNVFLDFLVRVEQVEHLDNACDPGSPDRERLLE